MGFSGTTGAHLMMSNSEREEILEATIAGMPRVAQVIAAIPAKHRGNALEAAEQSYLQSVQDLGYAEAATRKWVSAVMFQLLEKMEEELSVAT
jgi:dihydrodipicolinate synthase/N-acetylneuraminate lyase